MIVHVLKSEWVCQNNEFGSIQIGFSHYNLGFVFQKWGIRLMLIWWHVCIHFK